MNVIFPSCQCEKVVVGVPPLFKVLACNLGYLFVLKHLGRYVNNQYFVTDSKILDIKIVTFIIMY